MYYFKKLWYKYNEVKRMKIIMALFLFVLILIGLFTMIGVIFLKGLSNFISGLFKSSKNNNEYYQYSSNQSANKKDKTVIIEGEVVRDTFIQEYIKDINKLKIGLDSDIASSLSSLTNVMKNMDSYIENHKNNEKDVKIMTEHYIPELLKHIKVYKEFSYGSFTSKHHEDIKNELLETINMVTNAYSTVLSEFYNSMALSVSSSLDAIKASIKLKGYVK